MTSRLDQLRKKKAQIDAQLKQAEARERTKRRKDETRRKIIIGALAKDHMDMHPNGPFAQELRKLMEQHITRPTDRELLNMDKPAQSNDDASSMRPNFTMAGKG